MTATQALTSGMPVASPQSGPSDTAADEGDASFGHALEQVFLSALDALKGGANGGKFLGSGSGEDGERDSDSLRDTGLTTDRASPVNVVLAALQSSSGSADAATAGAQEAGLSMPGQVTDGEGEFDAGQLLDALSTDATRGARGANAGAEFTENTTLRVLRRETHLAVVRAPVNVAETLGGLSEATVAGSDAASLQVAAAAGQRDASMAQGTAEGSPLGAAMARSPGETAQMRRDAATAQADARGADASEQTGVASSFTFEEASRQSADQQASGDGRGARGERDASSQTTSPVSIGLDGTRTQAVRDASGDIVYETPAEQIFSELRTELDAEQVMQTSTDGAKKVLHLELKPASLGSVTVRIALKDNVVTLHLEAQRSDTLAAIERDRDALAGALKSAGYAVDSITSSVQTDGGRLNGLVAAASDANPTAPQGNPQGSFAQSSGDGSASSFGQGGSGQRTGENHDERHSDRASERSRVSAGGADGLYV